MLDVDLRRVFEVAIEERQCEAGLAGHSRQGTEGLDVLTLGASEINLCLLGFHFRLEHIGRICLPDIGELVNGRSRVHRKLQKLTTDFHSLLRGQSFIKLHPNSA